MAISQYRIEFTETALEDLRVLRASDRSKIEDAIETYLRYEPDKVTKSRIKRLRGLISPEYRLRVDEHRVFYDIEYTVEPENKLVLILAVKHKSEVNEWLTVQEVSDETDSAQ
ncbi:type II toxin-antitoxin system RelE/ParE family toxin [Microcoleus sp. C2C3]|uniref:type II toxin-antitoxin system RelE/ParE family toxin n=1 Tax=unclassified Microcoleus TaxID=2642155 RepID=UPI002FD38DCB